MKTIHNIINDFNLENGGAQKIVRLLHLEVNKIEMPSYYPLQNLILKMLKILIHLAISLRMI